MQKRILRTDRIRHPDGRFSFIPHRFLLDGFIQSLNQNEVALYFFLTLASDQNGISFYGQRSICSHLHQGKKDYHTALKGLTQKDLVAFDGVFYQVLELPKEPIILYPANEKMFSNLCRKIGNGGKHA